MLIIIKKKNERKNSKQVNRGKFVNNKRKRFLMSHNSTFIIQFSSNQVLIKKIHRFIKERK